MNYATFFVSPPKAQNKLKFNCRNKPTLLLNCHVIGKPLISTEFLNSNFSRVNSPNNPDRLRRNSMTTTQISRFQQRDTTFLTFSSSGLLLAKKGQEEQGAHTMIGKAEAMKTTGKRKKVFGFRTFCNPHCPIDFTGAFRDNVRVFLRECGDVQMNNVNGMPVWCTMLVDEVTGLVFPLYTVEEASNFSDRPLCEYCRCSGQSHHFVAKRKYHFVIPSDEQWDEPLSQNFFDVQTHLLHGLIHCNDYGHLLVINGREGGSKHVYGRDIMNLWDRICTSLHTREVTVEDLSQKKSMDLKLLYGVSYGLTWFGRWGYRFHIGSFGVNEYDFNKAIDLIASQDLEGLIEDFEMIGRERELKRMVDALISNSTTKNRHTVRDLLCFLLDSKNRKETTSKPVTPLWKLRKRSNSTCRKRCRDFDEMAEELDSRWAVRRLRGAAEVIVDALVQNGGMLTRQEVRDASRKTIGDTGLLDFVLKSLSDCIVSGYVVRRTQNPENRVLEFTIEDYEGNIEDTKKGDMGEDMVVCQSTYRTAAVHQGSQVERDIVWVYKHILLRGKAGETVINGKLWMKSWPLRDEMDDQLRFLCRWMPSEGERILDEIKRALPPPEIVVMPLHASVGDLRKEVEKAMRDTYSVMESFVATRLEGVVGEECEPLFGAVESGATVWVKGSGVDLSGGERRIVRFEGGSENWTVDCSCGAMDDDGERMVACDICEVWQHTKCSGIDDGEEVPRMFLCGRCTGDLVS